MKMAGFCELLTVVVQKQVKFCQVMPGAAFRQTRRDFIQRFSPFRLIAQKQLGHSLIKKNGHAWLYGVPLLPSFVRAALVPGKRGFLVVPSQAPFTSDQGLI